MRKKLIILSLLMYPLLSVSGCNSPSDFGTTVANGFKDVFISKADLYVTSITSTDIAKGVSIIQSFATAPTGTVSSYKFNEPVVTIANRPGLPRVIFKQMIIQYSIGNKQLPVIKYPITFTVPIGGQFSGTIPALSVSDDLVSAAFPNNSVASTLSGNVQITLLGLDDSNNVVSVDLTTPIRFESDITGLTAPSASPSPSPSPSNNIIVF